jgi:hypothetical protein
LLHSLPPFSFSFTSQTPALGTPWDVLVVGLIGRQ